MSDSPAGSNPEKDSALDSDNSNTDLSDVNWETIPPVEYGDSAYRRLLLLLLLLFIAILLLFIAILLLFIAILLLFTICRYISSSDTTADSEDLNPFAEGSVPWIAIKKTKKLKLGKCVGLFINFICLFVCLLFV